MIIGLGHEHGVGKDEAAAVLVRDHGFVRLSFADVLRGIAYDSDHATRRIVDLEGWDVAKRAYPAIRNHLDDLGRALRRHVGANTLVDAVFGRMVPDTHYVIPDTRHPNEVAAVQDHGGIVVKITRPGATPLANGHDDALAGFTGWDAEIQNDGTLDDLRASVTHLLASHKETST